MRARPRLRSAAPGGADGADHARALRARRQSRSATRWWARSRPSARSRCCCSSTSPARSRTGSLPRRALGLACALLICLGTLASAPGLGGSDGDDGRRLRSILFAGVVSSVLAGATTSLLLAFILPVSLSGPPRSIPDRVAGWGLAAAVSLLAISLMWPAPTRNPVRTSAIAACRALADRLRAEVAYVMSGGAADAAAGPSRGRCPRRRRGATDADRLPRHPVPADGTDHRRSRRDPPGRRDSLAHSRSFCASAPAHHPPRPNAGRSARSKLAAADVLERRRATCWRTPQVATRRPDRRTRPDAFARWPIWKRATIDASPGADGGRSNGDATRREGRLLARPELPRAGAELRRRPDRGQHRVRRRRCATKLDRSVARTPARGVRRTARSARERAAAPTSSGTRCGCTTA